MIFILVFLILIATYSGGGLNYHLLMIVGFGILIASDVHKIFVGRRDPPQGLSEKLAEMKQINMIIQQRIQEHEQKKANSEISMEHNTVQPDTKPISNADKSGVQQIF